MIYKGSIVKGSGGGSGDAVWGAITGTLSDQTDLAAALAEKQDTLTAGSNITINNNIISATDTTYSAFTGATGSVAGSAGLVPAPATTDNDKYLKGDGTWAEAGGSVSYDGTTINENASNELQAIGVKEARTDTAIRFWHGTEAQYNVGGGINPNETYYNWEYSNENWTSSNLGTSLIRQDVVYGNGIYATNNGNSALYSTDNQNWNTSPTMYNSGFSFRLGFGNNIFVAYSANYTTGYYTSDFSSWTQTSIINLGSYPTELVYGNNKFVIISMDGKVAYSTDGITWNQSQQQLTGNSWSSLTFGNGRFVATGGTLSAYSTDGETWTEVYLSNDSSDNFISVTFGNNSFVAISYRTNKLVYSQDGISWQNVTLPVEIDITNKNISFGNGLFIIYSYQTNSDTYYWYSKDLLTWQKSSSTFPIKTISVFSYVNDKFIVESNQQGAYAYGNIELNSVYTLDENPTTASTVYDAPNTPSTLTITSVSTGTITLSDTNTYTYNAGGNTYSYYSVGESYPNYVCNIDGVGLKIGDNLIADATGNVLPSQTGNSGKYLTTDGTTASWATVSGGATGSFTSQDGKTITVTNGVITSIV